VFPALRVVDAQIPADPVQRWKIEVPVVEELKAKAKALGLWNLFLSKAHYPEFGVPLTNLEVRLGVQNATPILRVSGAVSQNSRVLCSMRSSRRFSDEACNRLLRLSTARRQIQATWVRVGRVPSSRLSRLTGAAFTQRSLHATVPRRNRSNG